MSAQRDLKIARCCFTNHQRAMNMHSVAVSPLSVTYRKGSGIILAVWKQQKRWPCYRRGSGVILAMSGPLNIIMSLYSPR